ncbi:hypothetical protein P9112_004911 [Eukaryota sp. TZLM1-RC]
MASSFIPVCIWKLPASDDPSLQHHTHNTCDFQLSIERFLILLRRSVPGVVVLFNYPNSQDPNLYDSARSIVQRIVSSSDNFLRAHFYSFNKVTKQRSFNKDNKQPSFYKSVPYGTLRDYSLSKALVDFPPEIGRYYVVLDSDLHALRWPERKPYINTLFPDQPMSDLDLFTYYSEKVQSKDVLPDVMTTSYLIHDPQSRVVVDIGFRFRREVVKIFHELNKEKFHAGENGIAIHSMCFSNVGTSSFPRVFQPVRRSKAQTNEASNIVLNLKKILCRDVLVDYYHDGPPVVVSISQGQRNIAQVSPITSLERTPSTDLLIDLFQELPYQLLSSRLITGHSFEKDFGKRLYLVHVVRLFNDHEETSKALLKQLCSKQLLATDCLKSHNWFVELKHLEDRRDAASQQVERLREYVGVTGQMLENAEYDSDDRYSNRDLEQMANSLSSGEALLEYHEAEYDSMNEQYDEYLSMFKAHLGMEDDDSQFVTDVLFTLTQQIPEDLHVFVQLIDTFILRLYGLFRDSYDNLLHHANSIDFNDRLGQVENETDHEREQRVQCEQFTDQSHALLTVVDDFVMEFNRRNLISQLDMDHIAWLRSRIHVPDHHFEIQDEWGKLHSFADNAYAVFEGIVNSHSKNDFYEKYQNQYYDIFDDVNYFSDDFNFCSRMSKLLQEYPYYSDETDISDLDSDIFDICFDDDEDL